MNDSDQLWRVTAPHFVAGICVAQDGTITHTAPILKWANNRPLAWFQRYCAEKGWTVEPYSEGDYWGLLGQLVRELGNG